MLVRTILVPEANPGTVRKDRLESSTGFLRTLPEQYAKLQKQVGPVALKLFNVPPCL